ncbi:MAG TPA: hybrid sensor histidine kinase/response regulator [Gemmatimonadaceae bacterium]|nr:hybrid sensor histidine kinase/response regulator [Gemmatimonadaceae bacterium]
MSQAKGGDPDLSGFSMAELFRMEAETQIALLTDGLLAVEREPGDREQLDALMRAAHSLKGAARMSGEESIVRVAHAMEDIFEGARRGTMTLTVAYVDVLLSGVDLIARFVQRPSAESGEADPAAANWVGEVNAFLATLAAVGTSEVSVPRPATPPSSSAASLATPAASPVSSQRHDASVGAANHEAGNRDGSGQTAVRVTAEHLSRLLALAGESVVVSRWVTTFAAELTRLRRSQEATMRLFAAAQEQAMATADESTRAAMQRAHGSALQCQTAFTHCLAELEAFERRSLAVSHRLYEEVMTARMRPFSDGVQGLPRMVRDLARTLGKRVQFTIEGEHTPIDRDILMRLEAPLVHLLRNVLDHGIESPDDRVRAGKPEEGRVRVSARHRAGMLMVSVEDDGRGVDPEMIRSRVVERNLTTPDVAAKLSTPELLEFLFLPGFSTKGSVTEISGRGVGLDAVLAMVRDVGGTTEIVSQPGEGMRVQLQLPVTLSVMRALIVQIDGESYAVPLARITRVLKVPRATVQSVEGHRHVLLDDRPVGLVLAQQILGTGAGTPAQDDFEVVVLGDKTAHYGLVVDHLLAEQEIVVRPLDTRLGKVATVSAAALLPDGTPVLILDVDDVVRSIQVAVSGGRLAPFGAADAKPSVARRRVLVVDDSITVRETERKLLESAGYDVDVAVDGMDGWNSVRTGHYDLVVTDVDMPRLTGIELTTLIRKDVRLKTLPIMIVSYKDREEDRLRGLDAGADYYLTKASFHDDTLLRAAEDLLGVAAEAGART